nr:hypothetical protein [Pandoravirus massiliensis]
MSELAPLLFFGKGRKRERARKATRVCVCCTSLPVVDSILCSPSFFAAFLRRDEKLRQPIEQKLISFVGQWEIALIGKHVVIKTKGKDVAHVRRSAARLYHVTRLY